MRKFIITIGLLFLFPGCITTLEDAYISYKGKAKIIAIRESHYNPTGKNEYVDIFFDFIPDDATAPGMYIYKKFPDSDCRLFYNHRGNHLKKWVTETKIKEGNVYTAIRYEKKGSLGGAPVFFDVKVDVEKKD